MERIKINIYHDDVDHTFVIDAYSIEDVSKTLRGARETGYYNVNNKGEVLLIGSDIIKNSIINIK